MTDALEGVQFAELEKLDALDLAFLSSEEAWNSKARSTQILPIGGWSMAIAHAGRGWGKTETGAQFVRRCAGIYPGIVIHAVAPTHSDLIGVMFTGISGLLSITPPELIESTNFSAAIPIIKFKNGSIVKGFSSQSPDRLRGPQGTIVWGDEIAAWENAEETLANIDFSTRIVYKMPDGRLIQPQKFYTTTPRPLKWLSSLIERCQIVINGSTYENRDNLAADFLSDLAMYEGTEIGRQEIHGELLSIGDAVIVKEKWLRLWPANKPLPWFDYVVVSMDTALTEKTYDKKQFKNDPTACTVWGVFSHEKRWNTMLLNSWDDLLGMPQLIEAAKKEMRQVYGRRTEKFLDALVGPQYTREQEKKPDVLIIEEKGSGISLRQMLSNEGQDSWPYNPGRADKLARIHSVSHVPASGRVWIIESEAKPGEYKSWMKPFIKEVCAYAGPKTTPHDDYVDTCSQFWRFFADRWMPAGTKGTIKVNEQMVNVGIDGVEQRIEHIEGEDRRPGEMPEEELENPYG